MVNLPTGLCVFNESSKNLLADASNVQKILTGSLKVQSSVKNNFYSFSKLFVIIIVHYLIIGSHNYKSFHISID